MTRTSITSGERMDAGAAMTRIASAAMGSHWSIRREMRPDGMGHWPDPGEFAEVLAFTGGMMSESTRVMSDTAKVIAGESDGTPVDVSRRILGRMIPAGDVLIGQVNDFMESHDSTEMGWHGIALDGGSGNGGIVLSPLQFVDIITALVSMDGRDMDERFMCSCYRASFTEMDPDVPKYGDLPLSAVAMFAEGEGLPVIMDTYRSLDGVMEEGRSWNDHDVFKRVNGHERALFDIRAMIHGGCLYGGDPALDAWDESIAYAHADWMLPGFMDGGESPVAEAEPILRAGAEAGYDAMLMRLYRIMYSEDKDRERWMMRLVIRLNGIMEKVSENASVNAGDEAGDAIASYPMLADDIMNGYPVQFVAESVIAHHHERHSDGRNTDGG